MAGASLCDARPPNQGKRWVAHGRRGLLLVVEPRADPGRHRRLLAVCLAAAAAPILFRGRCAIVPCERCHAEHPRRSATLLPAVAAALQVSAPPGATAAIANGLVAEGVDEPLAYCGGGFCASFSVDGRRFRGVIDTGSPFLLVSTCTDASRSGRCVPYCSAWGCTTPADGKPSGLTDTDEVFAAGSAHVAWRRGSFGIGGAAAGEVIYGAMLEVESYGGNGGGAFLGLVRDKASRIRPTFLGQTDYLTLVVNLQMPGQERLKLSKEPMRVPPGVGVVPLLDLRGTGAPIRYYAAEITSLSFAGERVAMPGRVIAVLDTGTTGLGLPAQLFERYDAVRRARTPALGFRAASAVKVELATERGPPVVLGLQQGRLEAYGGAQFDIVTPIPEPAGMEANAAALWAGSAGAGDGSALDIVAEGKVAQASPGARSAPGRAQTDRPVARGERFLVRLLAAEGAASDCACDVAVGLAVRGGPGGGRLFTDGGACAYTSGSVAAGARTGPLAAGDVVECGLTAEGAAYWRINDGPSTPPLELGTTRLLFPTVEAGQNCRIELLQGSAGAPAFWAAPLSGKGEPVSVLFLGLGFLLGRSLSIDMVAGQAMLES